MKERGSILILAIISVLILSIMAIAGLTVSTTETHTTDTVFLNKNAYYTAVEGIEIVRDMIYNDPNPGSVTSISRSLTDTEYSQGARHFAFMTGSLIDLEAGTPQPIDQFEGFQPPPFPGISLGASTSISPVIWDVRVTSRITAGRKIAYSEIQTGVYSILTTGY